MFTPLVRILLIIGSLGMGIYFYTKSDFLNMAMIILCAVFFVYGYFKSGTVYIAHLALKKEDFDKAEKLISKIKNPHLLSKGQKSYFHFTLGAIASNNKDWETSYSEWTKALNIGLRTENDASIALLNLANVELERKNFKKAHAFITKVRKLKLKPFVKSETDNIENKINAAQQGV